MAVKADRHIIHDDIRFKCTTVGEAGTVVVSAAPNSGVALGDTAGTVSVPTSPSGKKVVGVLGADVVTYDRTKYHGNFHKEETFINEPCVLWKKARFTTDKITGNVSSAPTPAYMAANGNFTATISSSGGLAETPLVGEFTSTKDENGFATVEINLP